MRRFKIDAVYHADVELVVEVEDGKDPELAANWNIVSEDQTDYRLWDHQPAVLIVDEEGTTKMDPVTGDPDIEEGE